MKKVTKKKYFKHFAKNPTDIVPVIKVLFDQDYIKDDYLDYLQNKESLKEEGYDVDFTPGQDIANYIMFLSNVAHTLWHLMDIDNDVCSKYQKLYNFLFMHKEDKFDEWY